MHEEQDNPPPRRLNGTGMWLLGLASQRARQAVHERLASHGIRKWHYAVLATLTEFGPATQAEIGRRLGVDRSDLVAILNDLEGDGFLNRTPDPTNRRRNQVTLTPEGRTALRRFDACVVEADEATFGALSPAERKQLVGLLEKIVTPADPTESCRGDRAL